MSKQALVGVDVGGTKTALVVSLSPPEVIDRVEFPTRPAKGPEPAIRQIQEGIHDLISRHHLKLQAIGVSCGGPLDRIAGIIQSPPNLPTWVDIPLKAILENEFGVPCRLENDANAGAVAEHRFGAGQGCQNMVFLTMGTGLGAGIITDGRLYHGAKDLAGEIGHVRLSRAGPVGHNKAGSAEGWASGGGMAQAGLRAVQAALQKKKPTLLAKNLKQGKTITARDIGLAARQGDTTATGIIQSTGRRLGEVLAILVDILNPERIVIGGLAMRLGATLLDPAREVMRREALRPAVEACQIVPAQLDERIGDVAALCVAMGF